MSRDFDKMLDGLSSDMPEPPSYAPPESTPMEKTVLVDLASEVEAKKTYINDREPEFKKRQREGFSMAPPVDVYEPGFRTDLAAAIKHFFKKQRDVRENNDRIRKITGIGRTF